MRREGGKHGYAHFISTSECLYWPVLNDCLCFTPRITNSNTYMPNGGITVYSESEFKLVMSGEGIEEIKLVLFTTSNSSFGESCYDTDGGYHTSDYFDNIEWNKEAGLVVVSIGMLKRCYFSFFKICADGGLRQYDGQRTYYLCVSTSKVIFILKGRGDNQDDSCRMATWFTRDQDESWPYMWTVPSCQPGSWAY